MENSTFYIKITHTHMDICIYVLKKRALLLQKWYRKDFFYELIQLRPAD